MEGHPLPGFFKNVQKLMMNKKLDQKRQKVIENWGKTADAKVKAKTL